MVVGDFADLVEEGCYVRDGERVIYVPEAVLNLYGLEKSESGFDKFGIYPVSVNSFSDAVSKSDINLNGQLLCMHDIGNNYAKSEKNIDIKNITGVMGLFKLMTGADATVDVYSEILRENISDVVFEKFDGPITADNFANIEKDVVVHKYGAGSWPFTEEQKKVEELYITMLSSMVQPLFPEGDVVFAERVNTGDDIVEMVYAKNQETLDKYLILWNN